MLNYSYGGIMFKQTIFLVLIVFSFSALFSAEEQSDTLKKFNLPSITVTSTRAARWESPIPFSEMYFKNVEKIYTTQDIPRLLSELPSIISFSQSGNDIGYSNLTMRGFNQRRISVMINGIPQNDPEDHNVYWIDFPDFAPNVQNIQVQRGAGFTNYGSPSIGGSINLSTGNFLDKKGVRVMSGIGCQEFGYGNATKLHPNVSKYAVEFSSGLVDNYAFYGRLSKINSLGYRDHSFAFLNSYFFSAVRFDENFSTQINVFGGPLNDGLVYNGLPKEYIKDFRKRRLNLSYWGYTGSGDSVAYSGVRRKQEVEEFSQPHYEILNEWQIAPNLRFLSALFYYTGDGYFDYDGSWADTTMLRITYENGFAPQQNPTGTIIRAFVGNKQGGWIPRIIWSHGQNELTAGLEIRIHRSDHWGKIRYAEYLPENFDPDYKFYSNNGIRDIFSAFAREKLNLSEKLDVFFEGQLVYQRYAITDEKAGNKYVTYTDINGAKVSGEGNIFDIKYWFFNPRLGVNYNYEENLNLYGFVAYSSREPRMHNLYRAEDAYFGAKPQFEFKQDTAGNVSYDFSKPIAKPEKLLDIEIGANFKLFEALECDLGFYFMDYTDELVKTGRLDIFGNPIEENVPKSRHIGAEIQLNWKIIDNEFGRIDFSGNATLSNNRIVNYNFINYQDSVVSFKGNPISGFPDFMGNLRISYAYKNFFVSILGQYVGDFRTDNYGDLLNNNQDLISHMKYLGDYYKDNRVDSYFVTNLDVNYTFYNLGLAKSLRVQLQIKNLFNRLYAAGGEGKEFFPAAERNFFLGLEVGF